MRFISFQRCCISTAPSCPAVPIPHVQHKTVPHTSIPDTSVPQSLSECTQRGSQQVFTLRARFAKPRFIASYQSPMDRSSTCPAIRCSAILVHACKMYSGFGGSRLVSQAQARLVVPQSRHLCMYHTPFLIIRALLVHYWPVLLQIPALQTVEFVLRVSFAARFPSDTKFAEQTHIILAP